MNSAPPPERPSQPPASHDDADLFDYAKLRDQIGFVLRAVRRRKLLFLGVVALVIGSTAGLLALLPKTYRCESKLLAQRNQTIAALGNPGRNLGWDDVPLRAATEMVLRHDNLVSLIRQTDAVRRWPLHRAPLLHWKDEIFALLGRAPTPEAQMNALIGLLGTRLQVKVNEGTVGLGVDWNDDAEMSCRLVEAAQENFLEARHVAEISTISEAISILEAHALRVREQIDTAVNQIETLRASNPRLRNKVAANPSPERAAPRPEPTKSNEVTQLESMLEGKRRAIKDLEEFHRRRLADLQARLAEQRNVYSDQHPAVIEIQQRIEMIERQEPSQLASLRAEERDLEEQLQQRTGDPHAAKSGGEQRLGPLPARVVRAEREAREGDDPAIEQMRGELSFAMNKYSVLLDRIDSAHMELDTSRAAFKYRYTVLLPAELPSSPIKPKPAQIIGASVFAALILGILAAALADVRSGRILEAWQVRRQLDLEIIATVPLP